MPKLPEEFAICAKREWPDTIMKTCFLAFLLRDLCSWFAGSLDTIFGPIWFVNKSVASYSVRAFE